MVQRFVYLQIFCAALAAMPAFATDLVTNGSFESGLSSWVTNRLGAIVAPGGCATPWNVSNAGTATQCDTVKNPIFGTQAAYTSFDGYGAGAPAYGAGYTVPAQYGLYQTIAVPANLNQAVLSWSETLEGGPLTFYSQYYSTVLPRVFSINLYDNSGNHLSTLYSQSFVVTASGYALTNWTANSTDVLSSLTAVGGQTVRLEFDASIPQYFTGGAGFGLDNISLLVSTPEPSTFVLLFTAIVGGVLFRWRGLRGHSRSA